MRVWKLMKTGMKKITLQAGRERSVKRFHPWIFSGAIASRESGIVEGDAVEVVDSRDAFLGCGFYSDSSIAIKMFSFRKVVPDTAYWRGRFTQAKQLRERMGLSPKSVVTNAYRLINAEGDGIPGLIVDIYGEVAVVQCHSRATYLLVDVWCEVLKELFAGDLSTIYCKSADTLKGEQEDGTPGGDRFLSGSTRTVTVVENGLRFTVDIEEGQKTGFFVDQRDNRQLVRELSQGRRVLNLFCYTGGFSVAAASGGASSVTSVDVSGPALKLCEHNLRDNGANDAQCSVIEQDCFTFLEQQTERYDLIVVDPPPFAKSRAALDRALQGYRAINNLALKRLEKQGMVLTFSCSQVVLSDLFTQAVSDAGVETGRQLRILRELSSPACHPVSLYHPEGDYLKGLLLSADN